MLNRFISNVGRGVKTITVAFQHGWNSVDEAEVQQRCTKPQKAEPTKVVADAEVTA